jgi:hypothetical protein
MAGWLSTTTTPENTAIAMPTSIVDVNKDSKGRTVLLAA